MKKIFIHSIIISTLCLMLFSSISVWADTTSTTITEIEYMKDGSYFETTVTTNPQKLILYTKNKATSGNKTITHYSSKNIKLWSLTVYGSYTYNGSSSTCTSCSSSKKIYNSNWKVTITSTKKTNNLASTTGKGKHYTNGNIDKTITKTVSLRCAPNGTLY